MRNTWRKKKKSTRDTHFAHQILSRCGRGRCHRRQMIWWKWNFDRNARHTTYYIPLDAIPVKWLIHLLPIKLAIALLNRHKRLHALIVHFRWQQHQLMAAFRSADTMIAAHLRKICHAFSTSERVFGVDEHANEWAKTKNKSYNNNHHRVHWNNMVVFSF